MRSVERGIGGTTGGVELGVAMKEYERAYFRREEGVAVEEGVVGEKMLRIAGVVGVRLDFFSSGSLVEEEVSCGSGIFSGVTTIMGD